MFMVKMLVYMLLDLYRCCLILLARELLVYPKDIGLATAVSVILIAVHNTALIKFGRFWSGTE